MESVYLLVRLAPYVRIMLLATIAILVVLLVQGAQLPVLCVLAATISLALLVLLSVLAPCTLTPALHAKTALQRKITFL